MSNWLNCKSILCIRADNMGDVIMTGPALRALKETFKCKITLLTSSMGALVTDFVKEIDETIICNLPWVKLAKAAAAPECLSLIDTLKEKQFDGAVIFTVYSQSALPAALITLMAGIPLRLAYCRENPYSLLTDWVPDEEPYTFIRHQVERDLYLVKQIGASPKTDFLNISYSNNASKTVREKLIAMGVDVERPFIILHPGVSEKKREYPLPLWHETAKHLSSLNLPMVITGVKSEKKLAEDICNQIDENVFIAAGVLTLEEFIALVGMAVLVVTVNTSTVHIAAALQTPSIVLYALTNPQHTPWKSPSKVLYFPVTNGLESKNEVVRYVSSKIAESKQEYPSPLEIFSEAEKMLLLASAHFFASVSSGL